MLGAPEERPTEAAIGVSGSKGGAFETAVAVSVIVNEVRIGAGGDSCSPYVHTASEPIENNKLRFQAATGTND